MLIGLLGSTALAGPPRSAPIFAGEPNQRSSNGAMLLRWDIALGVGDREYQLQEASDPQFGDAIVRYRGSFPSWFMSGRVDGTRYFRVRSRRIESSAASAWSEWSATKVAIIEHHDLTIALVLFGFGALVFIGTCLTLIVGSLETNRAR